MTNIVERLRDGADSVFKIPGEEVRDAFGLLLEVADKIERLRAMQQCLFGLPQVWENKREAYLSAVLTKGRREGMLEAAALLQKTSESFAALSEEKEILSLQADWLKKEAEKFK